MRDLGKGIISAPHLRIDRLMESFMPWWSIKMWNQKKPEQETFPQTFSSGEDEYDNQWKVRYGCNFLYDLMGFIFGVGKATLDLSNLAGFQICFVKTASSPCFFCIIPSRYSIQSIMDPMSVCHQLWDPWYVQMICKCPMPWHLMFDCQPNGLCQFYPLADTMAGVTSTGCECNGGGRCSKY